MDAAGKDGAIKHVMSGVNPQGCQVFSFKHPSATELQHDFLWRTTRDLPERGRIGIFNRSYYEEVLIVRVHPEILRSEGMPDLLHRRQGGLARAVTARSWTWRRHLHDNGTRIIKFFLHLSKEEQRKRFLERIDEPEKNWKFSQADIEEREYWKHYMKAYEECLGATSTSEAPWYVVPADDKENARLIVSQIVLDTLEGLEHASIQKQLLNATRNCFRSVNNSLPENTDLTDAKGRRLWSVLATLCNALLGLIDEISARRQVASDRKQIHGGRRCRGLPADATADRWQLDRRFRCAGADRRGRMGRSPSAALRQPDWARRHRTRRSHQDVPFPDAASTGRSSANPERRSTARLPALPDGQDRSREC